MDYLEIARARQSCRAYHSTRPEQEDNLHNCHAPPPQAPNESNAQT